MTRLVALAFTAALIAACGDSPVFLRDWQNHPAVVTLDTSAEIVVVGDIHGAYDRLVSLLQANGVIVPDAANPVAYSWAAGNRVLVCTGDVIDKGDRALPAVDLLMALAAQAPSSGGRVIVTIGNHEAEFLADPLGDKTKEFRKELETRGLDPRAVAHGGSGYGDWLRNLPFAARVNGWFFSHAGNSAGRSLDQLDADYRAAVSVENWDSPTLMGQDSLLEARKWWENDPKPKTLLAGYLAALGAKHFVFGHDPDALGGTGKIADDKDNMLVLVDVGMSPAVDYSLGELLLITRGATEEEASRLTSTATRDKLFTSPL